MIPQIAKFLFSISGILFAIALFIFFRNGIAFEKRNNIRKAISAYNRKMIDAGKYEKEKVEYDDMESYWLTLIKFYRFGYKGIMKKPKDYEKIKEYL